LGHHRFDHGSRIDLGLDLFDDVPAQGVGSTSEERVAEAFASWFLMPRPAVVAGLGLLGVQRPTSPLDVYRLALLLGTGYRTTVRHLPNLRLLTRAVADSWLRVAPGRLKATLDRHAPAPASREGQVWLVDERFHEHTIRPHVGDRVVVRLSGVVTRRARHPRCFTVLSCGEVVADTRSAGRQHEVREARGWELVVEVSPEAAGLEMTIAVECEDGEHAEWRVLTVIDLPRLGQSEQWLE
jgi:hypothetical protein